MLSTRTALAFVTGAQLLLGWSAGAQTPAGSSQRAYASRAELEAALVEAERLGSVGADDRRHYYTAETALLRNRLQQGDFQEGDRITLTMPGIQVASDTFVVRAGKVIHLPEMSDFSVEGLLRSELQSKLTAHVARYLRDPSIDALPLVRLSVIGRVGRMGFYYAPADALLSDVIMLAGGLAPDADLGKVTIRRLGQPVWTPGDVRIALAEGLTIDRMHLRAGDEIEIGKKSTFAWGPALQVTSALVGLAALIFTITRR